MSERSVESMRGEPREPLPWAIAPWLQPLWYAYLAWCWWQVGADEASRSGAAAASPRELALVPAGKLAVFLLEAGFYRLWWRSRGRDLPFWRFFCVVASASLADVLAAGLAAAAARGAPSLAIWLSPIAGLHVAGDRVLASPALRAAFGTLGALTVVRIGLTAHAQTRALGVSASQALGLTTAVWLLGRIVLLWAVDLARGVSPLPAR